MKKLDIKLLLSHTATITFGVLLVNAVWRTVFCLLRGERISERMVPETVLFEILTVGVLIGVISSLFIQDGVINLPVRAKMPLHILLCCSVVLVFGYLFGWYSLSIPGVIAILASIAAVYALTTFITFRRDKQLSDKINKLLDEQNGDDEGE